MNGVSAINVAPLLSALLAALAFPPGAAAVPRPELLFIYPDMKPFIVDDDGRSDPTGPLADFLRALTREAGIDVRWRGPVPRARIIQELQRDGAVACTPNVLATQERIELGFRFSFPITPSPAWSVVARLDAAWPGRHGSFAELRAADGLSMGRLQGASHGASVDAIVGDGAGKNDLAIRGTPADLLRLLASGRVDYVLLDKAEVATLAATNGLVSDQFRVIPFADLATAASEGGGRIMCSPTFPEDIMARLNAAISRVTPPPRS